jgi:short-subunit dehydrogenase
MPGLVPGIHDRFADHKTWMAGTSSAMTKNLRPVTVITGASAGIGAALARVFARHGHGLALVARREDRLRALADEIAATGARKPLVIAADLQRPDAAKQIGETLAAQGDEPQYLVNNAGFGLVGLAGARDRDEVLAMIDVNVRALTELSLAFIDSLARHRGGLLNVGSLAGFVPGPGMAVYYATKSYVLSLSEALHSELKSRGVRVTVLCPGPVPTEFAERAGVSVGSAPGPLTQSAERVAEAGYRGLMRGQRAVVPGLANKLVASVVPLVPRRLLLGVIASRQRRRRSAQGT